MQALWRGRPQTSPTQPIGHRALRARHGLGLGLGLGLLLAGACSVQVGSTAESSESSDSQGPSTEAGSTSDEAESTDSSTETTQTSTTTSETDAEESSTSETGDAPWTGPLEQIETLDLNAVVATKGMDIDDQERVFVWNYNQDQLERWDGTQLEVLADMGLVSGFGTDLSVDEAGNVVVSKGGDTTGEQLMKWNGETGAPMWGPSGLTLGGSMTLGLTHARVGGEPALFVGDGGMGGDRVLRLSPADGNQVGMTPVQGKPLDVAVNDAGELFVLSSTATNPVISGAPIELSKYAPDGTLLAGPVSMTYAVYLALGPDGILYVSVTDFDTPTRRIESFDQSLGFLAETLLPGAYTGFAGGITTGGDADNPRVFISAQQGVGSGPICDVLVYGPP